MNILLQRQLKYRNYVYDFTIAVFDHDTKCLIDTFLYISYCKGSRYLESQHKRDERYYRDLFKSGRLFPFGILSVFVFICL